MMKHLLFVLLAICLLGCQDITPITSTPTVSPTPKPGQATATARPSVTPSATATATPSPTWTLTELPTEVPTPTVMEEPTATFTPTVTPTSPVTGLETPTPIGAWLTYVYEVTPLGGECPGMCMVNADQDYVVLMDTLMIRSEPSTRGGNSTVVGQRKRGDVFHVLCIEEVTYSPYEAWGSEQPCWDLGVKTWSALEINGIDYADSPEGPVE